MSGKPEHYWTPPNSEPIVAMIQYRDMIVVATSGGVYYIAPPGTSGLVDHEIRQLPFVRDTQ